MLLQWIVHAFQLSLDHCLVTKNIQGLPRQSFLEFCPFYISNSWQSENIPSQEWICISLFTLGPFQYAVTPRSKEREIRAWERLSCCMIHFPTTHLQLSSTPCPRLTSPLCRGKHCHTLSYSSPYPDLGHHLHAVSLNPNHLCICKARLHPSPNAVMMEAAVIQMQLSWGRGRAIYPGAGECQHLACASQRRRNPQNKSWAGIWKIVLSLQ